MTTVYDVIASGALDALDLNCSEKIVYAANMAYSLGLDREALKLAAGFGGGMGAELTCGAIAGGVMVLGRLFVRTTAHAEPRIRELAGEFVTRCRTRMGSADCAPLKARYRREDVGCRDVVLTVAGILDGIIARELG